MKKYLTDMESKGIIMLIIEVAFLALGALVLFRLSISYQIAFETNNYYNEMLMSDTNHEHFNTLKKEINSDKIREQLKYRFFVICLNSLQVYLVV